MSDKHLEVSESTHKEIKKLSKEKRMPIKYLVEEALRDFLESQKQYKDGK